MTLISKEPTAANRKPSLAARVACWVCVVLLTLMAAGTMLLINELAYEWILRPVTYSPSRIDLMLSQTRSVLVRVHSWVVPVACLAFVVGLRTSAQRTQRWLLTVMWCIVISGALATGAFVAFY